ncbi:MAG: hypothetical protein M3O31_00040 [Acidobacteriota bacterium]|nr:hypothetical protein [Acidobacteriota bacterium]
MKLHNPKFLIISALCGGMGVLSGYAIFLTYRQLTDAPLADHARSHFVITLLLTAGVSYAIEWIREVIREGKIEQDSHPIFRTMGTFVIVLMFELFILGFHTTSDLNREALRAASQQLLGPESADSSANWTLLLAGGLWIVVGALLAAWLSQSVKDSAESPRRRIYLAARNGLVGGLIFAPLVLALYILSGRSIAALIHVFHDFGGGYTTAGFNPLPTLWHNIWLSQNTRAQDWLPKLFTFCVMLPFGLLVMAAQKNIALFMTCFLGMAAYVAVYPRLIRPRLLKILLPQIILAAVWIVCLVYTVGPFGYAMFLVAQQLAHPGPLWTLTKIILLAAVIWAVPGTLLGALTPLLRRVSSHTRNWAFVGYGSALLLIAATLLARAWWPLIPAVAALAVGYMFQRGSRVSEYWPFAALCVAAGICGATSITQQMTFAKEVHDLHAIDVLQPASANQPAVAGRVKSFDQLSPAEKLQVEASPEDNFTIIRSDDGRMELVPVRMLDDAAVKKAQLLFQQNAADMIAIAPDLQPILPNAKDLTPPSPLIQAAIDRMNHPDTAPATPPAAHRKTHAPQPSPFADDKTFPDLIAQTAELFPAPPKSSAATKKPRQPAVVQPTATRHTAAPTTAAPKEAAPATAAQRDALEPYGLPSLTAPPTPIAATAAPTSPPATAPAPISHAIKIEATHESPKHPLDDPQAAAKALELSLSGSVGFWVTVGLLACWSMEENDEQDQPA